MLLLRAFHALIPQRSMILTTAKIPLHPPQHVMADTAHMEPLTVRAPSQSVTASSAVYFCIAQQFYVRLNFALLKHHAD
jgi:hypothetical protein